MESKAWMKYALFSVNAVIMVYALVALIIDAVTLTDFQAHTDMLSTALLVVPALTIAISSVAILLAILGCIIAFRKSYCMGITYCVMVSVFFLIETLGGVTYYTLYLINLYTQVENKMDASRENYMTSPLARQQWDTMQRTFRCCGVRSALDWADVFGVNQTTYLPMSCCEPITGEIGNSSCTVFSVNRYRSACAGEFGSYLEDNTATSGYTMIGLLLLQIASLVFGSIFTHPLRSRW